MTYRLKFAALTLLAVSASWFAPSARADEWDKQTTLTFSEPVQIPGQVLQAGTYVFKLADMSSRNVVQIFTQDQEHLVATINAVPDYRPEPTDHTVVTLGESPAGSPQTLQSWFYPGDTTGLEFVYSKTSPAAASAPSPQPAAE